jgi:hypothetical protein
MHLPAFIKHRELIGIVGSPRLEKLFHQDGLAAETTTGDNDSPAFPCGYSRMHKKPSPRRLRDVNIHVRFKGLQQFILTAGSR